MARGSAPGERRGGRQKGTPNKATAVLKDLAQNYTEEAVTALAEVMRDATAPAVARVSAATALLDRGHGKPRQEIEHTGKDGKDLIPSEADPARLALGLLNILTASRAAASGEAGGVDPPPAASD